MMSQGYLSLDLETTDLKQKTWAINCCGLETWVFIGKEWSNKMTLLSCFMGNMQLDSTRLKVSTSLPLMPFASLPTLSATLQCFKSTQKVSNACSNVVSAGPLVNRGGAFEVITKSPSHHYDYDKIVSYFTGQLHEMSSLLNKPTNTENRNIGGLS